MSRISSFLAYLGDLAALVGTNSLGGIPVRSSANAHKMDSTRDKTLRVLLAPEQDFTSHFILPQCSQA